jgi:uncharacterized protein (DUF433 family)
MSESGDGCGGNVLTLFFRSSGDIMTAMTIPPSEALIGAAEAAFIADLDQKELHRVVDEDVLPDDLLARAAESRRFARLGAAVARFYFATSDELTKAMRVDVIEQVMRRLRGRANLGAILALQGPLTSLDWSVRTPSVTVDLLPSIEDSAARAARAKAALGFVVEDDDVLGGRPTFRGTRVPIDVAIGASPSGAAWERLRASYPFLTPDHVDAANVYAVIRPRRGRPPRASESAGWKRASTRRIAAQP